MAVSFIQPLSLRSIFKDSSLEKFPFDLVIKFLAEYKFSNPPGLGEILCHWFFAPSHSMKMKGVLI